MWHWKAFSIVTALAAAFAPIVSSEVVASMNGVSSYIRAEIPHNIASNPFATLVWFWPPASNAASSGTSRAIIYTHIYIERERGGKKEFMTVH